MKKNLLNTCALGIALMFIAVSYFGTYQKARAVSVADILVQPFTGTIQSVSLCCNGIKLKINKGQYQSPIDGTMIFQWQNMIPIYQLGWGLYQWWQIRNNAVVLGTAQEGGECITISSECEDEDSVDYSIQQMGTDLGSSSSGSGQTGTGSSGSTGGISGGVGSFGGGGSTGSISGGSSGSSF